MADSKYPVKIDDEVVFWGRTKANYFWGKRSNGLPAKDVPGQYIFKIKKWGNGHSNSGPVGWKARVAKRGRI